MKRNEVNYSPPISVALGTLLAVLTTLLSTMLIGIFINYEYLCIESNQIVASIIQIISALVGTIIATALNNNNRLFIGLITGIAYYIILLLSAMLFMDGIGEGVVLGVICTATGVIGAILLGNFRKQGAKRGKRRKATR